MSENRWADPAGFAEQPAPVLYRVRAQKDGEPGELVERKTTTLQDARTGTHFHALSPDDQHLANKTVALIQQACGYFHASDEDYAPLEGVADVKVSDDEVRARIERLDRGENTREADRTSKDRYPLTELPFDQQRALVEQIEDLKRRWGFEFIGEDPAGPAPQQPSPLYGYLYG